MLFCENVTVEMNKCAGDKMYFFAKTQPNKEYSSKKGNTDENSAKNVIVFVIRINVCSKKTKVVDIADNDTCIGRQLFVRNLLGAQIGYGKKGMFRKTLRQPE